MTLELLAVRIGAAVMKAVSKSWLRDNSILTELSDRGIKDLEVQAEGHLNRRKLERFIDECADLVAARLLRSLEVELRDVPTNEKQAAIEAAAATLESSDLSLTTITSLDFDATRLERLLTEVGRKQLPSLQLSEGGERFYRYILRESTYYICQLCKGLPAAGFESSVELLRRQSAALQQLGQILDRIPAPRSVSDFAVDYARMISAALDKMELFGVRLHEENRSYPLSIAYLGLTASFFEPGATTQGLGTPSVVTVDRGEGPAITIEHAVAIGGPLMVSGEAGSGKTTLLRWLAVKAARQEFSGILAHLNALTPFYIPLRRYASAPFPTPERFPETVASAILEEMPKNWVHNALRTGAIVLVDGVDELPDRRRQEASHWLSQLIDTFPSAVYVVTSRPLAIAADWESSRFQYAELRPMSPSSIEAFINQWYEAARVRVRDRSQLDELHRFEEGLVETIGRDRHLRRLAVNPLLCALLCALNRELRTQLPRSRMEIYEAALTMLIDQRDRERGIEWSLDLSRTEKTLFLQRFALWLARNGSSAGSLVDLRRLVSEVLSGLRRRDDRPDVELVTRHLVERSGVLRQPVVGEVDFVHKTFLEYLAGKAAIEDNAVGELVQNAAHDQWREVIVMAAGHATASQAADLMRRLLARLPGHVTAGQSADRRRGLLARLASMTAGGDESDADRLRLLVAACLQSVVVLPDDVRDLVEAEVKMLMPPRSKSVALTLAQAGDFVLDLLPLPQGESELGPIVETARLIGGRDALAFLIRLAAAAPSEWADLRPALLTAWGDFDADDYARTVLAKLDFTDDKFTLESGDRVASVRFLNLRELTYPGSLGDLIQGGAPEQSFRLHKVTIALAPPPPPRGDSKYKLDARVPSFRVPRAEELDRAIAAVRELKETFIDAQDFESAAACRDQEKQYLALRRHLVPDLHRYLPDLKELELTDYWFEDLSWTPALPKLTQLTLAGLKLRNLRGLPRLDGLISLRICASVVEDSELTPIADACPSLHSLTIDLGGTAAVHLAPLARLGGLKEVIVHDCALVDLSNTTFEDHEVRLLIGPATRAVGTPHGIAIARGIALARSDR